MSIGFFQPYYRNTVTNDLTWLDNIKATFGTGGDADIYYDGTDLIINPRVAGSGMVRVNDQSTTPPTNTGFLVDSSGQVYLTITAGGTNTAGVYLGHASDTNLWAMQADTSNGNLEMRSNGSLITTLTTTLLSMDAAYLGLLITDTDGTVEGSLWYDASEDKLKFKTAAGVETITSS